jgi:hypothetical protein
MRLRIFIGKSPKVINIILLIVNILLKRFFVFLGTLLNLKLYPYQPHNPKRNPSLVLISEIRG